MGLVPDPQAHHELSYHRWSATQNPGIGVDYSGLNDETLLLLIARGHEEALGELYDRYNGLMFSIALEFMGDRALADDILQEVFTKVWSKADTYRPELGEVKIWLASLTRHQAIDMLRKRRLRPEGHSLDVEAMDFKLASEVPNPEEAAARSWQEHRLRQALAELPQEQRQALALAYFGGYTHRQIAEMLNEPLGTVKTRIRSAIHRLRDAMEDSQDGEI